MKVAQRGIDTNNQTSNKNTKLNEVKEFAHHEKLGKIGKLNGKINILKNEISDLENTKEFLLALAGANTDGIDSLGALVERTYEIAEAGNDRSGEINTGLFDNEETNDVNKTALSIEVLKALDPQAPNDLNEAGFEYADAINQSFSENPSMKLNAALEVDLNRIEAEILDREGRLEEKNGELTITEGTDSIVQVVNGVKQKVLDPNEIEADMDREAVNRVDNNPTKAANREPDNLAGAEFDEYGQVVNEAEETIQFLDTNRKYELDE
ncbi:MAG: hypothetical protein HRT47_09610 [Candidatus Caenarcaniphilales bacterium]|nr:hypothetical protein [Candidatus Caenarcaniphilales bacterium]